MTNVMTFDSVLFYALSLSCFSRLVSSIQLNDTVRSIGVSKEDKLKRAVEFFHEKREPFSGKELISKLSKEKGIVAQSVDGKSLYIPVHSVLFILILSASVLCFDHSLYHTFQDVHYTK